MTADLSTRPLRLPTRMLLVVFTLALGVRLAAVMETRPVPTVRHLVGDAAGYYAWAQRIAAGDWIGREGFYQAPFYPYVLAVWMKLFGSGVDTLRILQAILGASACALMSMATWRLFGAKAGATAGVMLALYAPAVYYDGIIQKASLAGFLTCALLAAVARLIGRRGWAAASVAGLASALLAITRENALAWVVVIGVWMVVGARGKSDRKAWTPIVAFVLSVAAVLFPVALRNKVVGGEWSVSTFQAGPNFYIGNHRGADGRYLPLVPGHETPQFERTDAVRLAEQATGRKLSSRKVSSYWLKRGFEDIQADPLGWARLMGYKFLLTLNRYEIADAESMHVHRSWSVTLGVLTRMWHLGWVAPLAVVGLLFVWSDRRRLWVLPAMIAVMIAAVAAFYVLGRYRYPIALLLIPFAAKGAVELWNRLQRRKAHGLSRPLALGVIVAAVVNIPIQNESRLDALATMNAGVALAQAGELPGATVLFKEALREHPSSAEAHNNLALAFAMQGQFAEAVEHYVEALRLKPALFGVEFNLAVALENLGRTQEALDHYRKAVEQDSADAQAQAAVQRLSR